jgi:hypothetical protein
MCVCVCVFALIVACCCVAEATGCLLITTEEGFRAARGNPAARASLVPHCAKPKALQERQQETTAPTSTTKKPSATE